MDGGHKSNLHVQHVLTFEISVLIVNIQLSKKKTLSFLSF